MSERLFRLTASGRAAWESQDPSMPAEYRRLLWLMDFHGQAGLMRELLKSTPREMLEEWLGEMEELGLIEQVAPGDEEERDFPAPRADSTLALAQARLRESQAASAELVHSGAYLSLERLRRRAPLAKPEQETTILIVEDDPDQLSLADVRMTMAGYQVRSARSVRDFLQAMFDDGAPDLLILDIELPDGSGYDLLARMRHHKVLADLPIILLTARNDAESIGRGLSLGADGYVTKPYTKRLLADVVHQVLKQGETGG